MSLAPSLHTFFADAWGVLLLFLIPIGGGIPGGVLLAKTRGLTWPTMTLLYFISDVILACLLEPILKTVVFFGRKTVFFTRFIEAFKISLQKSISYYGNRTGPVALVLISFGVDPMTGRAAAIAAGHGFVSGWMIAIAGDMLYFLLIMACTLWLRSVLGDGTGTTFIILVLMIGGPYVFRKFRKPRAG